MKSANFMSLRVQGKTHLATIVNTDNCLSGGLHWVAIYINLVKKTVILFNSVGATEYKRHLEPVKVICHRLRDELD